MNPVLHPADLSRLIADMKKKRKEPVDVERNMKVLERAHMKERKQKEDYAKFLNWKVTMQRKERERRDEEEAQHQSNVEDRLKHILHAHRNQRREEQKKWSTFAQAPLPSYKPCNIKGPIEIVEQEAAARQTMKAEARKARRMRSLRAGTMKISAGAVAELGLEEGENDTGVIATVQRLREKIGPTEFDALRQKKKSGGVDGDDPEDRPRGWWHEEEVKRIRRLHERSQKNLEERKALFSKAHTRRLYSMNKLLEDPPADYLIGGDVLRYVTNDVLVQPPDPSSVEGRSAKFFITALGEEGMAPPQQNDGLEDGQYAATAPRAPRRGPRRKVFDPLDLHLSRVTKLPPLGGRRGFSSAPPMRDVRQEHMIAEWYREHCMPYSKCHPADRIPGVPYHWEKTVKHKLPTMPSELYIPSE